MSELYVSRLLISHKEQFMHRLFNEYQIHQLVYSFFPQETQRQFLYFLDYGGMRGMKIIIQSFEPPMCNAPWHIEVKKLPEEFLSFSRYSFLLRYAPVSKCNGKVREVHTREDEAVEWLCRRSRKYGVEFDSQSMEKIDSGKIVMSFSSRDDITISYVDVSGLLNVTDFSLFIETIKNGIGPYKGFGLGLLQLRPAMEVSK